MRKQALSVMLQQGLSAALCFVAMLGLLSFLTVRYDLYDLTRPSYDPFVSIMASYFLILLPLLLVSLVLGRAFYRSITVFAIAAASLVFSNIPNIAR